MLALGVDCCSRPRGRGRVPWRWELLGLLAQRGRGCGGCVEGKWRQGGALVGSVVWICCGRFPGAPSVLAQWAKQAPSFVVQGQVQWAPSVLGQGPVRLERPRRGAGAGWLSGPERARRCR